MKDASQLISDYKKWFDVTDTGVSRDWAGGTLTRTDSGGIYTDSKGNSVDMYRNSNPWTLASANQGIMDAWDKNYGNDWEKALPGYFDTGDDGGSLDFSQMELFGEDISGLGPKTYSGIGKSYSNKILSALVPKLIESMDNYRSDIDESANAASDLYRSQSRTAMKEGAQNILNSLAARGVLNSDVAGSTLAQGMSDIATTEGAKAMESKMLGAGMKANAPSILSNIISNTGKYTESNNTLAPFEQMLSLYQSMM